MERAAQLSMDARADTRHATGLSVLDGVAVLVGVVVGVGIFGFPPLVAQHADSSATYIALWLAGGVLMLVGALCYAELGASCPSEGGEYHYLCLAWGNRLGLMFAWARGTVIQTGAIAVVAFIYGDYAQRLLPLGDHGGALHAAFSVVLLTTLNVLGTRQSKRIQVVLSGLTLLALTTLMFAGLLAPEQTKPEPVIEPIDGGIGTLGMGMVFVLLTYGGWNETAYLSGELRDPGRNMSRVLLLGTVVVTLLYLLSNIALLQIFGLQALRQSDAIGADLLEVVTGSWAAQGLSLLICLTALSTINATILTGARVYYALGARCPTAWDAGRLERARLDTRSRASGSGCYYAAADPVRRVKPERRAGHGRLYRPGLLVIHVHDGAVAAALAQTAARCPTPIQGAVLPRAAAGIRHQLPGIVHLKHLVRWRRRAARASGPGLRAPAIADARHYTRRANPTLSHYGFSSNSSPS